MLRFNRLPLAAIAILGMGAPAAAYAQTFDLRPTPTPTPAPVYGPVDPDRPRAQPTATPRPPRVVTPTPSQTATATLAPTPSATGAVEQPRPTASRSPVPTQRATTQRETPQQPAGQTQRPVITPADPTLLSPQPSASTGTGAPEPAPAQTTAPSAPPAELEDDEGSGGWWVALPALLGLLGGGAFLWWKRRGSTNAQTPVVAVPTIERPEPIAPVPTVAADTPDHQPAVPATPPARLPEPPLPEPIQFAEGPLLAEFFSRKFTATLMNASLSYTIRLTNRGDAPLTDLMAGGLMEAATDRVPLEAQLRPPAAKLPILHQDDELAPGESVEFSGDFRVPLAQLRPIVRGKQILFMPIARLRVAGVPEGGERVLTQESVLLGLPGEGAALGAIRLDEGPRVYSRIGQRLVAPQAA